MDEYKNELEKSIEIESEIVPGVKETETLQSFDKEPAPVKTGKFRFKNDRKIIKRGPLSKREKITFLATILIIITTGAGLLYWIQQQPKADFTNIPAPKAPPVKYYSPLSGNQVADEAATKKVVTAVMIENSPSARPQSGLAEAEVVFEAVAEGGITRFVALYQNNRPSVVGPVRSLRPYYAEWAAAFDPSVAHVGGSPEALTMIRSGNYGVDIDQFFNASSYWREDARLRTAGYEHSMVTNFDKLDALNATKKHTTSNFTFAPRVDEKAVETPDATVINLEVSSGQFSVSYQYDRANNAYARKQGGEVHNDREKGAIAPKVVVALKTNISLHADGSHMVIATSGSGKAYVFQNGTVIEGTWSKDGPKGQLFIKDKDGKEIKLVRGQTWISAVGNDRSVSWQ